MLQSFPLPPGSHEEDDGRCRHVGLSETNKRAKNQDRWFADDHQQIYIVADGMGGRPAGELVAETIVRELPPRLERAVGRDSDLNRPATMIMAMAEVSNLSYEIWKMAQSQPSLVGMGATLVMVMIRRRRALVVHLGDSRAYVIRDRQCVQVTHDHSLLQDLLDAGRLSTNEARGHIASTQLTRYAGMDNFAMPESHVLDLDPGDHLLLCTDGLCGAVASDRLAEVAVASLDMNATCESLVHEAKVAGSTDNITVVLVEVAS
jgi:PPM family protein phosphatase